MKIKQVLLTLALGTYVISNGLAYGYNLKNEQGKVVGTVDGKQVFYPDKSYHGVSQVFIQPESLVKVARETLKYLNNYPDDKAVVHAGLLRSYGVTLEDVKNTLSFIIKTHEEDLKSPGKPSSLHNSIFLQKNFTFYRWRADVNQARRNKVYLKDERIRLTKYVVFQANGSSQPSSQYCCALYAVPDDEIKLSPEEAELRKGSLIRYRYTKQQVVRGALNGNPQVHPLVWLTRQGLEDALMQGTLNVVMPDGKRRVFNVHRNNGILYNRRIKNPRNQNRYWYFKEVNGIQGYGKGGQNKITVQGGVTFAGDVYNIGLGKLVLINYPMYGASMTRLGIIADTGGAFVPNLYQLDYLAGVFPTRAAYRQGVKSLPTVTNSWILIKKK